MGRFITKLAIFSGCLLFCFGCNTTQKTPLAIAPKIDALPQEESATQKEWPWVAFRKLPSDTSYNSSFNVLCKSVYPGVASINGEEVKMYKTGIFFREVTFEPGWNTIRVKVMGADSTIAVDEKQIFYKDIAKPLRKALPLWIDSKSIKPDVDNILLKNDKIRVRFKGSKGKKAFVRIHPGKMKTQLARKDFLDYSLYEADLSLHQLKKGKNYSFSLILETETGKALKMKGENIFRIKNKESFPLVKTKSENTIMGYNLGPVRLGGPIIAEYGPGVLLQVDGIIGDYYRIYLNRNEQGLVHKKDVKILSKEHLKPSYFIQYASAGPSGEMDVVNIPYPEQVPYAIYPEPDQNRIRIALYGVKTSSTWLTHKKGMKVIDNITWQQSTPETYELIINLKTDKIWGYELVKKDRSLQFQIKHPPQFSTDEKGRSMKGLKVAIEAGHGGRNTGATGLSGMLEKEVNLKVALLLEKICLENGVEVVQVRDTDEYMTLLEKRNIVEASDAHLHVSIHANSAGTRGDYLRVGGVSTYYHNPFWADFAGIMYDDLLELPLDKFGVVGSFNYLVTRISSRPAILVEQGFMSHAEDEEKLASPEFRQAMAEKIFQGIINFTKFMEE
jgi:N-acetylmuramoyl-L-alanine amidase